MMKPVEGQGVSLMTESLGRAGDPAVVLVMGATASMLAWPDEFCAALVKRGLFVIRFDHRDTGESSTVPPGEAGYAVEDMAGDVLAVLDAYGLARAHVVGMSLGGYIAQMLAVSQPERVASLVLIGSEPLGWDGAPLPHISAVFLDHFAGLEMLDWTDGAAVTEFLLASERLSAGTAVPFDEAGQRARIGRVLGRTDSPASMFNHASLSLRDDWTGRFREISGPVSVIHGEEDPILPVANGQAIAQGIAGARLLVLPGIGHELPVPAIPVIADAIAAQVRAAG